jgi:hypothetical protein
VDDVKEELGRWLVWIGMELTRNGWPSGKLLRYNGDWKGARADM